MSEHCDLCNRRHLAEEDCNCEALRGETRWVSFRLAVETCILSRAQDTLSEIIRPWFRRSDDMARNRVSQEELVARMNPDTAGNVSVPARLLADLSLDLFSYAGVFEEVMEYAGGDVSNVGEILRMLREVSAEVNKRVIDRDR